MRGSEIWALVMNGVEARILRDVDKRDGAPPILLQSGAESTHLGEIMADKAGRSFASGPGPRRSAMEPGSDPVLREMKAFVAEVADCLQRHHRRGAFSHLAIFAEPKVLGLLRSEFPAELWETVTLDEALNLVSLSDHELRVRVRDRVRNRV